MRNEKLYLNVTSVIVRQLISILVGVVLPWLILQKFGSQINGMIQSITQMLALITMLDLGVGAVVQATLYSPLVNNDMYKISAIYYSAKSYFNLIAKILLGYVLVLCVYYSMFKSSLFDPLFSICLILAISISYFAEYYFGICNLLLLNADQRIYVGNIVSVITILLNFFCTVYLIEMDVSIQVVKLASSIVFLGKPIFLHYYVKKYYRIQKIEKITSDALPNKWSGLAQHVTVVVTGAVDNVILTLCSTFELISVYQIYSMPLNAIRNLIEATSTSYKSYFGRLISKNEYQSLSLEFEKYESIMHYIISIIFGVAINLLVPFVLVYTSGIIDTNYNYPLFSIFITFAYEIYSLRLIYTNLIFAAGKFNETQKYCVIECVLNIVISFALFFKLGILGVVIGTVISSGYRMIASVLYLKRDIIYREMNHFILHIIVDICSLILTYMIWTLVNFQTSNLFMWFWGAIICCFVSILVNTLSNFLLIKSFRDIAYNLLDRK